MKFTGKQKNIKILNRILLVTVLCIIVLAGLLIVLIIRQSREMDLSEAYTPPVFENVKDTENFTLQKADSFASGLCVSDGAIVIPDVSLQAAAEKSLLFNLDTNEEVDIDDVRFDFDPNEIVEGDYEVTFVTEGKVFKVHTTKAQEEGDVVSLEFSKDAIHVMSKMGY